jgi:hypothetical protein
MGNSLGAGYIDITLVNDGDLMAVSWETTIVEWCHA